MICASINGRGFVRELKNRLQAQLGMQRANVGTATLVRIAKEVIDAVPEDDLYTQSFNKRAFCQENRRAAAHQKLEKIRKVATDMKLNMRSNNKEQFCMHYAAACGRLLGKNGYSIFEMFQRSRQCGNYACFAGDESLMGPGAIAGYNLAKGDAL